MLAMRKINMMFITIMKAMKHMNPVTYDDLLNKPTDPNKTGQTFIGWFTEPTGGHAWNFAEDKMPAERLDLYARFGVATYKVTFDTGDQTTEYTYEYDTLIEKPSN
jgi:uncharacterized repeat protein (TIGR02543 family)